jgi:iron complex outermembrane receptor protein
VFQLKEVDISSEKLHHLTAGLKIEEIDSAALSKYISSNLSDILSSQTTIYSKTYGLGSLATMSIRGTSSQQNGLFWNGFNINVPNIGLSDFALIPGSFFNKIEILYGGSSSLYGNGIIGGSIHLENEPVFGKHCSFMLSSSAASFGSFNENARAVVSNENLCSVTAITYNTAKNDFKYKKITDPGKPELKLNNAETKSYGMLQELTAKLSEGKFIKAALWYQNNDRNIPASMTENESRANQKDESFHSTIKWEKTTANSFITVKGAYFYSFLHYTDRKNTDSRIYNNTGIVQTEIKRYFGYTEIFGGTELTINQADVQSYKGFGKQNRGALFFSLSHTFEKIKWKGTINLRKEFVDGFIVPFTPSIGFQGKIWKNFTGRINVSKNIRIPTLNDLYWKPGGNAQLKPETNFNQEAGLEFKVQGSKFKVLNSFTFFNSSIDNWIQWIPDSSNIYTPENIRKVWNRGIEVNNKMSYKFNKISIIVNLGYSFIKSTNQKKSSAFDESYLKQLIYTPEHSGAGGIEIIYRTFGIYYNQTYTGKRYVTDDHSDSLSGYTLGSLKLSKDFICRKQFFKLQFDIDNIWDAEYQALQYRPMPGRSYRLILNVKF